MKLQDFNFDLPQGFIAQYPLKNRDAARLMVLERTSGRIRHDIFSNLGKYLPAQSVLVVNDSKVIPARLFGKREETGGKVEVFLLNRLSDGYSFEALIRPLKKLKTNERINFNLPAGRQVVDSFYARLTDAQNKVVRFNRKDVLKHLDTFGHVPLPPYIKRPDGPLDREFYQTVYAKNSGSVASPTAGLHFSKPLLSSLKKDGHSIERLTLHVNYATFKPVCEEDITNHKMHQESYQISQKSWNTIGGARKKGQKIVAVGTTSCRVLEAVSKTRRLKDETDIFIYPGYNFQMTDALITNFHLPFSTLLILVCAFASRDLIMRAYEEAKAHKYRFYSYGDAMLIL